MKTIEITQEAGSDKMIRVTIPVDEPNQRYRIVILVTPESETPSSAATGQNGWPEGYFEKTYGSIQDDTFIRHPQGEYEKRLEME